MNKYGMLDLDYEDGETIPSIVFGDGTVRVMSLLLNNDGFTGVAFAPAPENKVVGGIIEPENIGELMTGMGVKHQLLFDNPKSIDVVIDALEHAKQYLLGTAPTKVSSLEACPFCGSIDIDPAFARGYEGGGTLIPVIGAGCMGCGATSESTRIPLGETGYKESTVLWNTRTDNQQLNTALEENEGLKAQLSVLHNARMKWSGLAVNDSDFIVDIIEALEQSPPQSLSAYRDSVIELCAAELYATYIGNKACTSLIKELQGDVLALKDKQP